jgi:6-pyruvoyltetrahydropterin/6-carboxytetrahydropterin synthase
LIFWTQAFMHSASKIFGIKVDREDFNFSAAQILLMSDELEALSGHNYCLSIDISGELNEDGAIVDFRVLKAWMRTQISKYNHKTLIPTNNSEIIVETNSDQVSVRYKSKTITLPRDDALLLPLKNTTCEELLQQIAIDLEQFLVNQNIKYISATVNLSESPGQCAYLRLSR